MATARGRECPAVVVEIETLAPGRKEVLGMGKATDKERALAGNDMRIKCLSCGYTGKPKYGRNQLIELVLLLTTWGLLWVPLWLYYGFTKRWVCPRCGSSTIVKE